MIDFLKRIRENGEIRIPFLSLVRNLASASAGASGRASARSVASEGASEGASSLLSVFDKFRVGAQSSRPGQLPSPSTSDGMNPGAYSARTIGLGLAALKAKGEKPPEEPKVVEKPPEEPKVVETLPEDG